MSINRVVQPSDLTSGRLRVEIAPEIDYLDFKDELLMKLLTRIKKQSVGRMKFDWLTKERRSDWNGIASWAGAWAAGAAVAGTITVTAGQGWLYGKGDVIKVPSESNVNIHVDSVSGDVLTCRTYDNSSTIDFSAGTPGASVLFNISNSFALGTNKGTMKSHQPSENSNYIQILQHPYGTVETMEHVNYDAGGPELAENEADAFQQHKWAMEKTFFFGQKHLAATGYQVTDAGDYLAQYFTGGFFEAITSNVSSEADLTYLEFSNWVRSATYYAESPLIFAGDLVFEALPWWLGERGLTTKQDETTLGIEIVNFKTTYGKVVNIVHHEQLLKNAYAGMAFSIDLNDIAYKYLDGEDTHLEVEIQTPGAKQKINEYRTWFGVMMGNQKRHAILKDVATISA